MGDLSFMHSTSIGPEYIVVFVLPNIGKEAHHPKLPKQPYQEISKIFKRHRFHHSIFNVPLFFFKT